MVCRELVTIITECGRSKHYQGHRVRLTSQFNLTEEKRDPRIIRNLMSLTFPHRRQLLIQDMSTMREVIDL